jgi:hypothetical protein
MQFAVLEEGAAETLAYERTPGSVETVVAVS